MTLDSASCFFCGKGEEDGGHLFIKCKDVKEVWRQLGLEQERRRIREGEPAAQVLEVVTRTRCDAMEYEQTLVPVAPKRTRERWQPPQDEFIKINLDGAFTSGNSFSGWGIAARDAHGHLLVARARRQEQVSDAFGAELHALAAAVTTATEIGAIRVTFETDSQLLAEAMDACRADASPYAAIIKDLLSKYGSPTSVIACRRNVNTVAHE
ncbi:Glutamyl-tRNA reductase 1, chloroplastic [Hordeum vulgare]|nr:Glutamyl-tRNA reductase 1, chloroplastic [Hordeum vulgare]